MDTFRENMAPVGITAGGAVMTFSPQLAISLAGLLLAFAGLVWQVYNSKKQRSETERHNRVVEEIARQSGKITFVEKE